MGLYLLVSVQSIASEGDEGDFLAEQGKSFNNYLGATEFLKVPYLN
jgi:hypothetical protein